MKVKSIMYIYTRKSQAISLPLDNILDNLVDQVYIVLLWLRASFPSSTLKLGPPEINCDDKSCSLSLCPHSNSRGEGKI